jgi:hypothetical protein
MDGFRTSGEAPDPAWRSLEVGTVCAHRDFHEIRTSYDRRRGILIYWWTCEHCGARLSEALRTPYRPLFEPNGLPELERRSFLVSDGHAPPDL